MFNDNNILNLKRCAEILIPDLFLFSKMCQKVEKGTFPTTAVDT